MAEYPKAQINITIKDPAVDRRLRKLAIEAKLPLSTYASQLFHAAFAAKVSPPTGDDDLDRAMSKFTPTSAHALKELPELDVTEGATPTRLAEVVSAGKSDNLSLVGDKELSELREKLRETSDQIVDHGTREKKLIDELAEANATIERMRVTTVNDLEAISLFEKDRVANEKKIAALQDSVTALNEAAKLSGRKIDELLAELSQAIGAITDLKASNDEHERRTASAVTIAEREPDVEIEQLRQALVVAQMQAVPALTLSHDGLTIVIGRVSDDDVNTSTFLGRVMRAWSRS